MSPWRHVATPLQRLVASFFVPRCVRTITHPIPQSSCVVKLQLTISPDGRVFVSDTISESVYTFSPAGRLLNEWRVVCSWSKSAWRLSLVYVPANDSIILVDPLRDCIRTFDVRGNPLCLRHVYDARSCVRHAPLTLAATPDGRTFVLVHRSKRGLDDAMVRVLQWVSEEGFPVHANWTSTHAEWPLPHFCGYMAVSDDKVVVTDTLDHCVRVYQLNGCLVQEWGRRGSRDGEFYCPTGVAVRQGHVFVVDSNNHRVQVFRLSDGAFVTKWGCHRTLPYPSAVAATNTHVYVSARHEFLCLKVFAFPPALPACLVS